MATKEMQARAKAAVKSPAKGVLSGKFCVLNADGTTAFNLNADGTTEDYASGDEYFALVNDALVRSANALVTSMSPTNVDLTLLDKATFTAKQYKVGGKKFDVVIHILNRAVSAVGGTKGALLVSVVQIWNGSTSFILGYDEDKLENARYNWNSKARIRGDDYLSQTVAAMRLDTQNLALHHICMHTAYEHKEMDQGGIHAVWD